MARATTVTLIPIDRVAHHLQIDPYHFNSIQTDLHPITPACSDDWFQHDWQAGGKLSRESVALALKAAESFTYQYLGWTPLPVWHEEEDVIFPQHYRTEVNNMFRNSQGFRKSIKTRWGYVIEAGYKDSTFIVNTPTVFSDEDLDTYDETVTITFATTVTEPQELHVFFTGKDGHPTWEIKPLDSISITGGVATITFPRYLIPLPHLWEQMKSISYPALAIDGDDASLFETAVDVYRVFTNPSLQIQFISDSGTATGELHVRREREGYFSYRIANWDDVEEEYVTACFNYIPVRGRIWYKAGFRDMDKDYPDLQMREDLERLIVYYALSKIDTELCGCSNTRNIWEHQSTDLARQAEGTSFVMPWDQLGNPFGTTRAAFNLWNWAKQFKLSGSPYAK